MTAVGFERTPLRTGALSQRLRPLGQTVLIAPLASKKSRHQKHPFTKQNWPQNCLLQGRWTNSALRRPGRVLPSGPPKGQSAGGWVRNSEKPKTQAQMVFFKTSKIWKTGPKPQVAKIGVLNHRQSRKLPSANILGRIKKTSKTQRIFRSDKIWKTRSEPKDTKKDGAKLIKVQTSGIDKFIRRSKNTRKKSGVSKLAKFEKRAKANRCKKGLLRHRQ